MNPINEEIGFVEYFRSRFWIWVFNQIPNHKSFDRFRQSALKLSGFNISKTVKIFGPLSISPKTKPRNIYLNGFLFINANARFSVPGNARLVINKNCLVGPNVSFETLNHGLHYISNKSRGAVIGNITLEEGVWVGSNSIVLQNVTIGEGAVVAASSVVNKNLDKHCLFGGVPAKWIKDIGEK